MLWPYPQPFDKAGTDYYEHSYIMEVKFFITLGPAPGLISGKDLGICYKTFTFLCFYIVATQKICVM